MQRIFEAKTVKELDKIALKLWDLFTHKIILFKADLGSGKTTLIKTLVSCKLDNQRTSSPSYSLINEYGDESEKLVHMDLYRLNHLGEALDIGIEDYLYSNNWTFIEWPELIEPILNDGFHTIEIVVLENQSRKIIFT